MGLILLLGVLAVSTAAILIRLAIAATDQTGLAFSLVMATARLSVAALVLLPNWRRGGSPTLQRGAIAYAVAAGLVLALHFATWTASLSFTSIAASVTLVTTNPLWVALLSWWWWGEVPGRSVLWGLAVALVGGVLVGTADSAAAPVADAAWLGNGLALLGAWAVSLYLLLGREAQRRGLPVGRYAAIAYSTAAIVLLPFPLLLGQTYWNLPPLVYGYLLLLGLVPQLIGHTSLNWAVRWLSPTRVALVILLEPIFASVLGYVIFGEVPGLQVVLGAPFLLVGVAIACWRPAPPKSTTLSSSKTRKEPLS